jgi:hypothetical protein
MMIRGFTTSVVTNFEQPAVAKFMHDLVNSPYWCKGKSSLIDANGGLLVSSTDVLNASEEDYRRQRILQYSDLRAPEEAT